MDNVSDQYNPFGDYIPKRCLSESETTRSWLAEQASVGRMVLIKELKEEAYSEIGGFMADVRAMAAVEHPIVGSVYEACTRHDTYYYAHELLPGHTLAERAASGEKIATQRLVPVLKKTAEANIYYETHGYSTSPIGLESIHLDDHGVTRIKNHVVSGSREPGESSRDVVALGREMEILVDRDLPGTTRCLTLLAWMRGQDVDMPLTWGQVRGYCNQIEQELATPPDGTAPATGTVRAEQKNRFAWVICLLLLAAAAAALFMSLEKKAQRSASRAPMPGFKAVRKGNYPVPGGLIVRIDNFRISAHEVTIAEYAEFLATLALLDDATAFDHPDQPKEKTNHIPDDWDVIYPAAKAAGEWNGLEIDVHTPVVGVDWWDAHAFAKSKRAYLPTQNQWLGALVAGVKTPSEVPVGGLLPVNWETADRTDNGLLGMAGSVSEWTSEPQPSPENPLGEPMWVICGGSYLKPEKGALTRQWVPTRALRRPDLGFRICKDGD